MVNAQNGDGARGGLRGPTLRELREHAKRMAFASVRISQAPKEAGFAEKEISDYAASLEGVKKDKAGKIAGNQESMAGETAGGRRLLLQEEVRRLGHTVSLLDEEIGLLQKTALVVERMEERIKEDLAFAGGDAAQKALCSSEAEALGAKILRLTRWLSQRREMPDREDKDIINEISYLKAYLGAKSET